MDNYIGIFDSGFGGISVLNDLINLMPNENYVYFADSANFPYGKKSKSELINIGKNIIEKFNNRKSKALVIACNTMSTSDLPYFASTFPGLKIIGTFPDYTTFLKPGTILYDSTFSYDKENGLKAKKRKKKVLIIATSATCKSSFLLNNIANSKSIIDVYIEPADFIAETVEKDELENFSFKNKLIELFKEYKDIDYLLLGCTHFPFAIKQIREILDNNVEISSSGEITAKKCFEYITSNNLLSDVENPYIKIIDVNIDDSKEALYKRLINSKSDNISFSKTF